MSGNAGDLNNDGYQDIILGNGSPRMERVEPLTLLQSDGRRFHDVTFTAGLPITGKSHGVNLADLFGDGRMTLIVASGGAYPGDLLTVGAFCPKERVGHYLNVRLVGTQSNRSAIGARIKIDAGGRQQHRLVSGGSQFGCLPYEQHFGLGRRNGVVDAIEIWWPSGVRQRIAGPIAANNTIRIIEGDDRLENVYPNRLARCRRAVNWSSRDSDDSDPGRRLAGAVAWTRCFIPARPGYDESRTIWNAMIDRRPALIARCVGVGDVVACVTFAREQRLPISVKGGGHNIAGLAVSRRRTDDRHLPDARRVGRSGARRGARPGVVACSAISIAKRSCTVSRRCSDSRRSPASPA